MFIRVIHSSTHTSITQNTFNKRKYNTLIEVVTHITTNTHQMTYEEFCNNIDIDSIRKCLLNLKSIPTMHASDAIAGSLFRCISDDKTNNRICFKSSDNTIDIVDDIIYDLCGKANLKLFFHTLEDIILYLIYMKSDYESCFELVNIQSIFECLNAFQMEMLPLAPGRPSTLYRSDNDICFITPEGKHATVSNIINTLKDIIAQQVQKDKLVELKDIINTLSDDQYVNNYKAFFNYSNRSHITDYICTFNPNSLPCYTSIEEAELHSIFIMNDIRYRKTSTGADIVDHIIQDLQTYLVGQGIYDAFQELFIKLFDTQSKPNAKEFIKNNYNCIKETKWILNKWHTFKTYMSNNADKYKNNSTKHAFCFDDKNNISFCKTDKKLVDAQMIINILTLTLDKAQNNELVKVSSTPVIVQYIDNLKLPGIRYVVVDRPKRQLAPAAAVPQPYDAIRSLSTTATTLDINIMQDISRISVDKHTPLIAESSVKKATPVMPYLNTKDHPNIVSAPKLKNAQIAKAPVDQQHDRVLINDNKEHAKNSISGWVWGISIGVATITLMIYMKYKKTNKQVNE